MRKMAWLLMIVLTLCAAAGAQAEGLTPVKVSEVTHSVFYAPQYAALALGFFEEEGLSVDLINGGGAKCVSGNKRNLIFVFWLRLFQR